MWSDCTRHRYNPSDSYSGVGLGNTLEEPVGERVDSGSSSLHSIELEPQVMGSVRAEVVLVTVQVGIPHAFYY